jgi:hypothetical protein
MLAARQHGNVTRRQMLTVGLNGRGIGDRVRCGRLHRVHRGVYAVGRPPVTPLERAAAAVLACGPDAALSHRSAMVLWGIWKRWETPLETSVIQGDPRPRGIVVHRAKLNRRDVTVHYGIRVTSPARTLLDCAPTLTTRALTRAVNDARHLRILFLETLGQAVERYPNHPGSAAIKPLLERTDGATRSGWEDDFPGFCAHYGLPAPRLNVSVCGYVVDALFTDAKLIVELDSWEYHQDRAAFERDRERDAHTAAAGFLTVRITRERVGRDPAAEAERLLRTLAARTRQ